ncbi:putative NADPH dehydrogenase [Smittium mucronatum]|uniref:Putative NADPH dehydrogenase n=1 Tax=Smittium mucronatum TaxID=133383 RepID=A0A1R0GU82_9FUNG|nr:putative NADPH dehydrogenase [Smittium mucronatum]
MKTAVELITPFVEDPLEFVHFQPNRPGKAIGFLEGGESINFDELPDKKLPLTFTPLTQRGVTFNNRIFVSPILTYSSQDGFLTDWHVAHYGGLSMHTPGGITVEATGVTAHGRVSINCPGIWKDEQIESHRKVVRVVKSNNVRIGLQLVHSGRKGSGLPIWESSKGIAHSSIGGWTDEVYGPTSEAFDEISADTKELTISQIERIKEAYVDAAIRADLAGYDYLEIHAAHVYLLSSFLSPISNTRKDIYGGSFDNRVRFLIEVVERVRNVFPENKPIWVRLSCNEWFEGGWDIEDSVRLARLLKDIGVDLVDCSSGGMSNREVVEYRPLFQVSFAQQVRERAGVQTGAVGIITKPSEIEEILQLGQSDIVSLGRQFLLEPSFVKRAAVELGVDLSYPNQYLYAKSLID